MKGDIKSVDIQKIVALFTKSTGSIFSELGSKLRSSIEINKRARAKKNFVLKDPNQEDVVMYKEGMKSEKKSN